MSCCFCSLRLKQFGVIAILVAVVLLYPNMTGLAHQDAGDEAAAEAIKSEGETTDFTKLKSPVRYTKNSIDRGKVIFLRNCVDCHDRDGQAVASIVAQATNLTQPHLWESGTTEGEIFRSIRDGAGLEMPEFKMIIRREEDLWHLVNFVRSLWPEDKRPKLQTEEEVEE